MYFNGTDARARQINAISATVTYSCVQGGFAGKGNINRDPCFASLGHSADPGGGAETWVPGDYHLQSQAGCWDPGTETWVLDVITSPCIDAGDPACPVDAEPQTHGGRVNMGAYGGTTQASKSP